jgi:hypothetical protein
MVDLFLNVSPPFPVGTEVVVTGGRWQHYRGIVATVPRHAMTRPVMPVHLDLRTAEDVEILGAIHASVAPEAASLAAPG